MNNKFYEIMCDILESNSENTDEGPRWFLPGYIITAKLSPDEVDIYIMFPDDTEISINCQTGMRTATICNLLKSNSILNQTRNN